jgi:hypothetical protein
VKELKVETFISGNAALFDVVKEYPELRMVPVEHVETVRTGLRRLGYQFRIRYRGPHGRQRDTHKADARAFTVYIQEELI